MQHDYHLESEKREGPFFFRKVGPLPFWAWAIGMSGTFLLFCSVVICVWLAIRLNREMAKNERLVPTEMTSARIPAELPSASQDAAGQATASSAVTNGATGVSAPVGAPLVGGQETPKQPPLPEGEITIESLAGTCLAPPPGLAA